MIVNLRCIFHTGLFYPPTPLPGYGIRNENYRPIHLEPIAHEFPELKIILAHLGVSWNQEAADLCRMFPNIYCDVSGRNDGWRSSRSLEWFSHIFYRKGADRKVLFGSDVHAVEVEPALRDHERIFNGIGWDGQQKANLMHANARRIFGLKG